MSSPSPTPARKRPFGVSVIISMLVLYVLLLAITLFAFFAVDVPDAELAIWILSTRDPWIIRTLFATIILIEASIAAGLWRFQRWAWVLVMIQSGILMASDLLGYFYGNPSYLTMFINVIIVFYLNQREVQRVFPGASGWALNA